MSDLNPVMQSVKAALPPPAQAQPSIAEELKPVPQAEIEHAVPPLPAKGGEPGLGEHLDLYDTQAGQNPPAKKAAPDRKKADGENADANADAPHEAAKKPRPKLDLLGEKTGLPQPTTDPIHAELPFLKPLVKPLDPDYLGQTVDARI